MREQTRREINHFWKTLQVKDDEVTLAIKQATFSITFWLSLVFGLFYATLYFVLGAYKTSFFEFLIIGILFPIIYIARKKKGHQLASHIFVFTYITLLSMCAWFTGGIFSPSYLWLLIPPFLASVLLETKHILIWSFVTMISLTIIGYLDINFMLPESEIIKNFNIFYMFSFIALIIFILGFMIVNNFMRLKMLEQSNVYEQDAQRNEYLATFAQVTAGLAHEINNPLTIALVTAKKILKNQELELPQEVITHNEKIVSSLDRISKIILSMKNLSRDSRNENIEQILVSELIDDTTNVFLNNLEDKNVALIINTNNLENTTINAHRVQLGQVLFNLIKNAMDEIKKVEERWIRIELEKKSESILIKVYDSGEGVDQESLDKIFSPFFSTKVVGEGTGLGLSLSHSLMKKNDGDLYYLPDEEHTCFVMEIPLYLKS